MATIVKAEKVDSEDKKSGGTVDGSEFNVNHIRQKNKEEVRTPLS